MKHEKILLTIMFIAVLLSIITVVGFSMKCTGNCPHDVRCQERCVDREYCPHAQDN